MSFNRNIYAVIATVAIFGASMSGAFVWAHGGKSHGSGGEFTNLEALKKATEIYDKLVASEKFGVEWETGLGNINITEREKAGGIEKIVSFTRSSGDPKSVYIFFKSNGEYAGSNFTGQ
jgi:hypothetical protein